MGKGRERPDTHQSSFGKVLYHHTGPMLLLEGSTIALTSYSGAGSPDIVGFSIGTGCLSWGSGRGHGG